VWCVAYVGLCPHAAALVMAHPIVLRVRLCPLPLPPPAPVFVAAVASQWTRVRGVPDQPRVADEAEDSAVGVATSSVRAAHVVPPRFSRHLHPRLCIEVLHEDGQLYCADIVCAYTTREGRRAARVARKSSNPGDRTGPRASRARPCALFCSGGRQPTCLLTSSQGASCSTSPTCTASPASRH
jgi:hypothetical protein